MGNSTSTPQVTPTAQVTPQTQPTQTTDSVMTAVESTSVSEPLVQPVFQPTLPSVSQSSQTLQSSPTTVVKKQPAYVHPFIELINRSSSESEIINMLDIYLGKKLTGHNHNGDPMYDVVDQTLFIGPTLQVFAYAANNGKKSVVSWLMENFVPLQVSYDNNFCYYECLKWNHHEVADLLASHESFIPTMDILESLLSRGKYHLFRTCMNSPYLKDDLRTYRFTFMHYVDTNNFSAINNLLAKIKQRAFNPTVQITDVVYPNPKLPKVSPVGSPIETPVSPMDTTPIMEPVQMSGFSVMETTDTNEVTQPVSEIIVDITNNNTIETFESGLHQRNTFTPNDEEVQH
jgi:hypothetical protein